jgi:hypothetical protein
VKVGGWSWLGSMFLAGFGMSSVEPFGSPTGTLVCLVNYFCI